MTESTFLRRIIAHKQEELREKRAARPEADLERDALAAPAPRPFLGRLDTGRLAVIAEIKRASPSKGDIAPALDATAQARRYAAGEADAISVLTDRQFYRGSHGDLREVRAAVPMPVLCKDFVLDRYGLLEARAAGADLVLLIVAALPRETLAALLDETRRLGMTPLVEVYTADEARVALEVEAELVGVNNRNLHTFDVSLETTERLAPLLVPHVPLISLSGVWTLDDARRVAVTGARGVLVGEALVRAAEPAGVIRALKSVPVQGVQDAPRVKICGVRTAHHARVAAQAGADMVGLIFALSKRQITPDEARAITSARYERRPLFVGVFVDEEPEAINRIAAEAGLDLVQLSGSESPEACAALRVPYNKVVHVTPTASADDVLHIAERYRDAAAIVLDTGTGAGTTPWGGTGIMMDLDLAAAVVDQLDRPVILAGGLRLETVAEAARRVRPWGVDVSSGVETDGSKDDAKIVAFIQKAKSAS